MSVFSISQTVKITKILNSTMKVLNQIAKSKPQTHQSNGQQLSEVRKPSQCYGSHPDSIFTIYIYAMICFISNYMKSFMQHFTKKMFYNEKC